MAARVLKCDCANAQQDKLNSKGYRVCNSTSKEGQYRCTVCAKVIIAHEKKKVVDIPVVT